MFPTINLRETGINLHRIMDKRGITPKDIKEFLNLGSIQTVYNWFNGLNMPTVDNLYALSQFLQVPIDEIICGNRKAIRQEPIVIIENPRTRRLYAYYKQLNRMIAAWKLKHSWNDKHIILLQNESITFCRRIFLCKEKLTLLMILTDER